jgi:hypothetical protein
VAKIGLLQTIYFFLTGQNINRALAILEETGILERFETEAKGYNESGQASCLPYLTGNTSTTDDLWAMAEDHLDVQAVFEQLLEAHKPPFLNSREIYRFNLLVCCFLGMQV